MVRVLLIAVLVSLLILASCVTIVPVDDPADRPQDPAPESSIEPLEQPAPSELDFTLFVDVDSVHGACSDAYSRDENSLSSPFCSIQRAADLVEPGDAVRIERGVYEERVSITRSGTESEPIVFSGVRGADGSWLTRIEGGTAATGWVRAPEMDPNGYGVYKADLGFRPYSMTADGRMLAHLLPDNNDWLAFSPTHIRDSEVVFWDGIEGIFGYNSGTGETYVRFRNGDDPNRMSMRAAPNAPAIQIDDAARIELRDLSVTNARYAVRVSGAGSRDVVIENNLLTNSEFRIAVDGGASRVTIRGNEILIRSLSDEFSPGPWSDIALFDYTGDVYYELEVKEQLYRAVGKWNEELSGRAIKVSGDGHVIEDNIVENAINAIEIGPGSDVIVRGNAIEDFSSVGVIIYPGADVVISDNEIRNVNIPLRFMNMNRGSPHTVRFYNNRISAEPRAGKAMYFHEGFCGDNNLEADHDIWIYHNSFSGSGVGLQSGCSERNDQGLPGLYVVNNVVSSTRSFEFEGDWRSSGKVGGVDHNWFLVGPRSAPWLGDENIVATSDDWMWPANDRDLILPANSPARNAGLDLSKRFVLNGKEFDPLPGMEPGYYSGSAPNLGAVQD
jgi:hypothetical protein